MKMDPLRNVDTKDDKVLGIFIETYKALPELWNPTHPAYLNKTKKYIALKKLLDVYIKIKPGAVIADVKRKINTLRSNYRKELQKILNSKRSGSSGHDVYKPTSWVFYALQFLDKFKRPIQQQVDQIPHCDGNQGESHKGQSPAHKIATSSRSAILSQSPRKKQRVLELVENVCSYLEQSNEPEEKIPTIAKAWGEKLNTLECKQRIFAEKAINDVLFEAIQGTLHRHSVKINESPRHEAISPDPLFPFVQIPVSLEKKGKQ